MNGARGLQAALAAVLVDDEVRHRLHEDPDDVRHRYALTDHETRVLLGIDRERLALTAAVGRAKRLDFVRRGMPGTYAVLEHSGQHAVLADFVRTTRVPADQVRTSRVLGESRRFTACLADRPDLLRAPYAWVRDLAAFELSIAELLADEEAGAWARRAERRDAGRQEAHHVVLGRHVKAARYEHDVIGLCRAPLRTPPDEVEPEPTHVVLVRRTTAPWLDVHRVGAALAALLTSCAAARPWAQVLAAADGHGGPAAGALVRRLLADGLLLPAAAAPHGTGDEGSGPCACAPW